MDFVSISITTHIYAIIILFFIMMFNYLSIAKMDQFISLAKRLRFMTPLYHMANAFAAYTGGIVAAYSHDLSITVVLMIAASIFVMVLEIKRYKKMRIIKSDEVEKQEEFRIFAKKISTMEILAVMFTYVISKLF